MNFSSLGTCIEQNSCYVFDCRFCSLQSNNPGTSPLGNGTEGNVGGPIQVGNQSQPGQAFPIQSFQSLPQVLQIPHAAPGVPLPTLNTVLFLFIFIPIMHFIVTVIFTATLSFSANSELFDHYF